MTPEPYRALIDAHPTVFVRPTGDEREPGHCLIACGDGWHGVLDEMACEIETLSAMFGIVIYVWQAKEKFGVLRAHWRPAGEEPIPAEPLTILRSILLSAERRSAFVCETCGKPGRLSVDDCAARTRCAEHRGLRLRMIVIP